MRPPGQILWLRKKKLAADQEAVQPLNKTATQQLNFRIITHLLRLRRIVFDRGKGWRGTRKNRISGSSSRNKTGELTDKDSQCSCEGDDDSGSLPMPPLKSARIMGFLPRDAASTSNALPMKIHVFCHGQSASPQLSDLTNEFSMPSGSKHSEGKTHDKKAAEWS